VFRVACISTPFAVKIFMIRHRAADGAESAFVRRIVCRERGSSSRRVDAFVRDYSVAMSTCTYSHEWSESEQSQQSRKVKRNLLFWISRNCRSRVASLSLLFVQRTLSMSHHSARIDVDIDARCFSRTDVRCLPSERARARARNCTRRARLCSIKMVDAPGLRGDALGALRTKLLA